MSILEAVVALATLVKRLSDDSSHNVNACKSLSHRVGLIPRLLEGFPDPTLLDDALMQNLFQQLRLAHDLIMKYKDMGRMGRALRSSFMKEEFVKAEAEIGNSVRDLTLAVGIFSASKISGLTSDMIASASEIILEDKEGEEEDQGLMDLADFGDMCETAETLATAINVFQFQSTSVKNTCSAAVIGNKLVVVNFPMSTCNSESLARKASLEEEYEEEESMLAVRPDAPATGDYVGIVIFHIDNTTSMKNHGRMDLTKKTLLDVIPDFLRKGFRVIMNAWASDPETKGRIQTREVHIPADILDGENNSPEAISEYLDDHVFTILNPKGKTDIYGSFFQLLQQCREICLADMRSMDRRCPLLLFVLTDGNHNHLDYPLHKPIKFNEDYFGVYAANKNNGTKFGRTEAGFSVEVCEQFLSRDMASLVECIGPNAVSSLSNSQCRGFQVTCTIIGIGEADTGALSSLAAALGPDVSFYGITQIEHIETAFRNVNIADTKKQLKLRVPGSSGDEGTVIPFQYCVEEGVDDAGGTSGGSISGCVDISDPLLAHRLHHEATVEIQYSNGPVLSLTANKEDSPYIVSFLSTVSTPRSQDKIASNQFAIEQAVVVERERVAYWESVLPQLKAVSTKPYTVTSGSLGSVFSQLLRDRKVLQGVKSLLFSRATRKMRYTVVFSAVSLWLRELNDLVEAQITSYRMNIEDELLTSLSEGSGGDKGPAHHALPSQMVLDRLQHNLKNAGKATHRINRLMITISKLRDRSVQVATRLMDQSMTVEIVSCSGDNCACCVSNAVGHTNGRLVLTVTRKDKELSVVWQLCRPTGGDQCICREGRVRNEISGLFDAASPVTEESGAYKEIRVKSDPMPLTVNLSFPCIALRANFDQFSIVHATNVFSTTDICTWESGCSEKLFLSLSNVSRDTLSAIETRGEVLHGVVFDAEELYEICRSSEHLPGSDIPMLAASDTSSTAGFNRTFNMVLPLAYTPMLFSLYLERGRVFHSAINVTGDCMSLAPVALQWGKFFHDAMILVPVSDAEVGAPRAVSRVWVQQALYAVVAYSYAIECNQLLPSKDALKTAFGVNTSADKEEAALVSPSPSSLVVIARDNIYSGLACPLGLAGVVAGGALPGMKTADAWNLLARTIFSRLCEAIAGHKNVRYAAAAPVAVAVGSDAAPVDEGTSGVSTRGDPGVFEESYRLLLGDLQMLLRHRLHVEWPKLDIASKIEVIQTAGVRDVFMLLQQIVDRYLSQFNNFRLTSWTEILSLLQRSLVVSNHDINTVKRELEAFSDVEPLVEAIIRAPALPGNAIPVFTYGRTGEITVREMVPSDYEAIVLYIDAIVATKASPKATFKPILNPSHPVASSDSSLKVRYQTCELDLRLPILTVGFMGNVNSGKSSILGRLLMDFGMVGSDVLYKLAKEAERIGHTAASKYAWLLDRTATERGRGVTIDSTWLGFQSCYRRFSVVDNPGHADFAKNCVNGLFQSDVAVLVTSAVKSEVVMSELVRSQAEDQLMVAFCFGIRQVVIAVNKMDIVGYSEECYRDICAHTTQLAKKAGFKPDQITFVPVSALDGVNLTSAHSGQMKWYTGSCLLETFDAMPVPKRMLEKPLRVPIDEVRSVPGIGTVLCGRVECGSLSVGDKLCVEPCGIAGLSVLSIETFHSSMDKAAPGENIGFGVRCKKDEKQLLQRMGRGMVACLMGQPSMSVMETFEAQLFIVRGSPIRVGYRPAITSHLDTFSVSVVRLVQIIGKNNQVITENPAEALPSQTVILEMKAARRFAGDTIHDNPRLSRFLIKENRIVVALGFIRRKLT